MARLKGVCIGGACVSEKHANFIINTGTATAADIEALIVEVESEVKRITGVALQREVRIVGRNQDDAQREADRLAKEEGLTMLPPFDHEHVIAGQGTIGLEILEDLPEAGSVVVPLSGGGLLAGIAGALYVPQVGIINPGEFSPLNSIEIVIWVAIGTQLCETGAVGWVSRPVFLIAAIDSHLE